MPAKHEHILHCRLSKRQRKLYDEYLSARETQATLASGNFMGVVGVLMQLRKVSSRFRSSRTPSTHRPPVAAMASGSDECARWRRRNEKVAKASSVRTRSFLQVCNHPDLFEGRPIVSSFDSPPIALHLPVRVLRGLVAPSLPEQLDLLLNHGLATAGSSSAGSAGGATAAFSRDALAAAAAAVRRRGAAGGSGAMPDAGAEGDAAAAAAAAAAGPAVWSSWPQPAAVALGRVSGGGDAGGEWWGSSPVLSVARGLLLGQPAALAAATAWEAARVEELQVRASGGLEGRLLCLVAPVQARLPAVGMSQLPNARAPGALGCVRALR